MSQSDSKYKTVECSVPCYRHSITKVPTHRCNAHPLREYSISYTLHWISPRHYWIIWSTLKYSESSDVTVFQKPFQILTPEREPFKVHPLGQKWYVLFCSRMNPGHLAEIRHHPNMRTPRKMESWPGASATSQQACEAGARVGRGPQHSSHSATGQALRGGLQSATTAESIHRSQEEGWLINPKQDTKPGNCSQARR